MSKGIHKAVGMITAASTMLTMSGFAAVVPAFAAAPADYGLTEGDAIRANAAAGDPDIYIVNEQGFKRLFVNPAIFNLYGHIGWASVKEVSAAARDAFPTSGLFRNCESGSAKVYGIDVISEDVANLRWVNTSGAQAVADDADFFKKVFCINNAEQALYGTGADYTSVNDVPDYSRTPGPTGPFGASLAGDNPASSTLIAGQAVADLAHFNITGSGAVTTVTLKRLGVSADTTLSNVFLFVNGARVSDAGNVSSGVISFNDPAGLFNAPATLVVKSNIAASTSGQTVGVQLTNVGGTAVSVSGNLHSIAASPGTLATVAIGAPTGAGDFDPQADVTAWTSTFTISNEDVYVRRLTLREIGSVDNNDITNLRLFVGGVQIATAAGLDSDGYVSFLANYRVQTGAREFKVVVDVPGGANRTMQFSLRGSYDAELVDESFNVAVLPTGTFPASAASSTIGQASVTVVKANDSPSGDVVLDATDVVLARYTVTGFGEVTKIETMNFYASVSRAAVHSLANARVLINGTQYGSTTSLINLQTSGTFASTSFTTNYTLQPGQTVTVEVRADANEPSATTDDLVANDIVSIVFDHGDLNNGIGQSSASIVDIPSSNLEGNNNTVTSAAVVLSKQTSYPDQTVNLPNGNFKIGSWVLVGSSVEAVNLTTFTVDIENVTNNTFNESDLSAMYVKYGSQQTSPKSSVVETGNAYAVNYQLQINETLVIEVYANLGSDATAADSFNAELATTGTGASSGVAANGTAVNGQLITYNTGTFTASADTGTSALTADGSTVAAGTWRFRGDDEAFTVSELRFKVAASTSEQAIVSLTLKDGGTVVQTQPLVLNGSSYWATFPGLSISTGVNQEKTLTVDVNVGTIDSTVTTQKNVAVVLTQTKYKNTSGVETTVTTDYATGAAFYAHAAIPVVTKLTTSTGATLTNGEMELAKFTVAPTGGTVGVWQFRLNINKGADPSITSGSFKVYENGSNITANASTTVAQVGTGQTSGYIIVQFTAERILTSTTTYTVNATITNAIADSLTATFAQPSSQVAPGAAESFGSTTSLVWTDRSASSHSATTSDWMNDFLVKDLPVSWGFAN